MCQCAEKKMVMCVQRLGMILCGCACSAPSEGILKETKKKGKAKSTKGRKQKEDTGLQSCSVSQLMFCQYFASFYCIYCTCLWRFLHQIFISLFILDLHSRLHSVLTSYLSDNSLSSVVRANKNLDNFVVRILREFLQWLIKNLPFVWLTNISQGHSYLRKIRTDKEKWDFFLLLL